MTYKGANDCVKWQPGWGSGGPSWLDLGVPIAHNIEEMACSIIFLFLKEYSIWINEYLIPDSWIVWTLIFFLKNYLAIWKLLFTLQYLDSTWTADFRNSLDRVESITPFSKLALMCLIILIQCLILNGPWILYVNIFRWVILLK